MSIYETEYFNGSIPVLHCRYLQAILQKKAGPIYFTTVYLCFTPLSYANALLEGERSFPADPLGQNVQLLRSYER